MFDHKTLPPQSERYFAAGSPEATLWDRTNRLRYAIASVTNTVAAVSPETVYAPMPTDEPAPVPAPAAGEVALVNSVSEIPETPEVSEDEPTIFDADPMHELSQELFLESARKEVMQAHQSDQTSQEYANAA